MDEKEMEKEGRRLARKSSHRQFVGRLQRRTAHAADDGGTVAAGERICHFFAADRAVKDRGLLNIVGHQEYCLWESGDCRLLTSESCGHVKKLLFEQRRQEAENGNDT
jgi:hypothetical protein